MKFSKYFTYLMEVRLNLTTKFNNLIKKNIKIKYCYNLLLDAKLF